MTAVISRAAISSLSSMSWGACEEGEGERLNLVVGESNSDDNLKLYSSIYCTCTYLCYLLTVTNDISFKHQTILRTPCETRESCRILIK